MVEVYSRSFWRRCLKKSLIRIVGFGWRTRRMNFIPIHIPMQLKARVCILDRSYVVSDTSLIVAHSLNWYRFIGRILGKAMYEGILIDVAFAGFFLSKVCWHYFHVCKDSRTLLQWLGKQSFLDDLASLDPELYNGLIFLKHYTGNAEDLSLNFTVAVDGALTLPTLLIPVRVIQ